MTGADGGQIAGKVVAITGPGAATAQLLAAQGARVEVIVRTAVQP
jgi:hypothetical protein